MRNQGATMVSAKIRPPSIRLRTCPLLFGARRRLSIHFSTARGFTFARGTLAPLRLNVILDPGSIPHASWEWPHAYDKAWRQLCDESRSVPDEDCQVA